MVRTREYHSFNPLPAENISKFLKLTRSGPMHLKINHLTFCRPGNVHGYLNPFMTRPPDNHSFDPSPWPSEYTKGCLDNPFMAKALCGYSFNPLPPRIS